VGGSREEGSGGSAAWLPLGDGRGKAPTLPRCHRLKLPAEIPSRRAAGGAHDRQFGSHAFHLEIATAPGDFPPLFVMDDDLMEPAARFLNPSAKTIFLRTVLILKGGGSVVESQAPLHDLHPFFLGEIVLDPHAVGKAVEQLGPQFPSSGFMVPTRT